jgi:environmental stress-induced protein Ves
MVLQLPGGEETVARDGAPLTFDGALAPMCRLLDGATRDLNLMSRRAFGRSSMKQGPSSRIDLYRRAGALSRRGRRPSR